MYIGAPGTPNSGLEDLYSNDLVPPKQINPKIGAPGTRNSGSEDLYSNDPVPPDDQVNPKPKP